MKTTQLIERTLVIVTLIFSPVISSAQTELRGSPSELRQFLYPADKVVTIVGQADETAYSDTAIISLVITTREQMLSQAISQNTALRAEVASALLKAGIEGKQINSSKFSSSPQYGWFGSKPSSYEVINRMAISIQDEQHLQTVAGLADKHSELMLSNTEFKHSKKEQYTEKVKDSIQKQQAVYEQSLGVKLTPIGIRESNVNQGATLGAIQLEEIVMSAAKPSSDFSLTKTQGVRKTGTSFDELVYQAQVSVDFKIEQ